MWQLLPFPHGFSGSIFCRRGHIAAFSPTVSAGGEASISVHVAAWATIAWLVIPVVVFVSMV